MGEVVELLIDDIVDYAMIRIDVVGIDNKPFDGIFER